MLHAPIRSFRVYMYLAPIKVSFSFFGLRGVQMGDSERAVCKMESTFRRRNVGFSLFLTCISSRFMRNAILLDRGKISLQLML